MLIEEETKPDWPGRVFSDRVRDVAGGKHCCRACEDTLGRDPYIPVRRVARVGVAHGGAMSV